jgi:hypothetical protein
VRKSLLALRDEFGFCSNADFSTFYRAINEEDEAKFTAKLTSGEGKLATDGEPRERPHDRSL